MSTADYDKTLRLAKKLTAKFGRSITLAQLNASPDNTAQPWKGAATVRSAPVATLTVNGVFVEPESLERLGKQFQSNEFVKSSEEVIIVATEFQLDQYDEVTDSLDGAIYKIANIQQLNPGDRVLLHYLRVQRRGHTTAVRGALL